MNSTLTTYFALAISRLLTWQITAKLSSVLLLALSPSCQLQLMMRVT
jgi:hypothetical protein